MKLKKTRAARDQRIFPIRSDGDASFLALCLGRPSISTPTGLDTTPRILTM